MNNLINIKRIALVIATLGFNVPSLWAAETAREDNSGLFVWIFLAFCALIVVAQLIPAMMVLLGFAKGVKKNRLPVPPKPVDDLTSPEG